MNTINIKNKNKTLTEKQADRQRIYDLALTGDVTAMRTLREVYDYLTIRVKGKLVNLREI